MNSRSADLAMNINGYEVSATFTGGRNIAAVRQIKQILLSSFVDFLPESKPDEPLALLAFMEDNNGGDSRVP